MEKLSDLLRYRKQGTVLTAAMVCQRAQEVIGEKGKVVSCNNKTLKIAVKDNYEAAAIAQNDINLIERINKRLGEPTVKRLRFIVQSY